MNLAELFVQLPPSIAFFLEEELECISISSEPTKAEVLMASLTVVKQIMEAYPEESLQVQHLLDQLPQAIVDNLF